MNENTYDMDDLSGLPEIGDQIPAVAAQPPAQTEPAPASAPMKMIERRKVNSTGNILLAGLFAGGIICVYLLSLKTLPATASAEQQATESKVDNALKRFNIPTGAIKDKKAQAVVNSFYYEARQRQVPISGLINNPFIFEPPNPMGSLIGSENLVGDKNPSNESADMVKAAQSLMLQSIMSGPNGSTAMISNNVLAEGQSIYGWTVKKIESTQVTLVWKEHQFVLRLNR